MSERYISTHAVILRLGIGRMALPGVAKAAGIRVRVLPGYPVAYHEGDIQKLAASAFRVAGQDDEPAALMSATRNPTRRRAASAK